MYYGVFLNNPARLELGITANEYMVCALVRSLCKNDTGWCIMSRANMAEALGFSKVTVIKIIDKMEGLFLIQKNSTGNVRTSPKWNGTIARHEEERKTFFDGKESLPATQKIGKESLPDVGKESIPIEEKSVKKVYRNGKESLPDVGKESLPYTSNIYTINYTLSNGERKKFSIKDYFRLFEMKESLSVKELFGKLPDDHKIEIAKHLPQYIELTPERRFRKSPMNYILDEIYLTPPVDRRKKNGKENTDQKFTRIEDYNEHAAKTASLADEFVERQRRKHEAFEQRISGHTATGS